MHPARRNNAFVDGQDHLTVTAADAAESDFTCTSGKSAPCDPTTRGASPGAAHETRDSDGSSTSDCFSPVVAVEGALRETEHEWSKIFRSEVVPANAFCHSTLPPPPPPLGMFPVTSLTQHSADEVLTSMP